MSDGGNAPSWLFSFVDLAFLLLIAMTQVAGDPSALDLREMSVPRVGAAATAELPAGAPGHWQLRVHPPEPSEPPFELLAPGAAGEVRVAAARLRAELARLHASDARKPLLAPHADSRSQDLLDAAAMIEELWPSRRRATVVPIFARP